MKLKKGNKKEKDEKEKPDRLLDLIIIKMMLALTLSVVFLFGGGTMFIYASFNNIEIEGYSSIFGSIFGVHIAILMLYYSVSLFKYIVSD
ncbi:MAG: hypothetical protein K9W45_05390 [Candidatus Heimdallarchaeum aukensis]|uniref:Uncharacterized protein n=1 Tax=Candidatus Heimdallarchaeum aukensis TaxID=2876573 RepID=A0A9Y1BMS8_9ARCH|nr:MAG: hypothetical protein K9W45_05390 [Candidatus Heimdallarchaeum aukensis]